MHSTSLFVAFIITVLVGLQDSNKGGALIGRYESVERSKGGIGATMEFQRDGRLVQTIGAMVDGAYRINGDTLLVRWEDSPEESKSWFRVTADSMLQTTGSGANQGRRAARRVGKAEVVQGSVVGKWSYPHSAGGIAVEEYTKDGQFHFRLPFTPVTLHYSLEGDTLTLHPFDNPTGSSIWRVTVSDTSLTMIQLPGGKAQIFRRVPMQ